MGGGGGETPPHTLPGTLAVLPDQFGWVRIRAVQCQADYLQAWIEFKRGFQLSS